MYRTGKSQYYIMSLGWGIIAYYFAVYINSSFIRFGWADRDQVVRLTAPIAEEIFKCLIVFFLVRRKDFVYIMDGVAYGFGAGIGFAVLENIEYISSSPAGVALLLAVARVFSTNLIHATGTAIVGAALGSSRLAKGANRISFPLGGLLIAIVAHVGFNNLVNNSNPLIFAFIYAGVGLFIIYTIVQYGFKKASADIKNTIGMRDKITANEAAIVNRMSTIDDILKPLMEHISPNDMKKVREFIILQAQLGLQRNNLNNSQEGPLREGIVQEIESLKKRIDDVRQNLSYFCMLQVRLLFPENNIPFWSLLEQRANTGRAGGGLWANLDNRTKESKEADAN